MRLWVEKKMLNLPGFLLIDRWQALAMSMEWLPNGNASDDDELEIWCLNLK